MSFKSKNKSSAIGIIGRTFGTTTMVVDDKEKTEAFLSYAAEQIKPCERTFKQLEEYLVEKYQAIPHTLMPNELSVLKANVIMNHFDYVLVKPAPLGENPTIDEIKKYMEENTSFYQAREYPAEKLGLKMKAYKVPGIASAVQKVGVSEDGNISYTEKEVIVEMEMKSEYLSIRNGGSEVIDDLVLYRGVSEKDIKERSPRFIGYAYILKRMGRLTSFMEV